MIKNEGDLLTGKMDFRTDDRLIEPREIFKQVQARTAMHLGKIKGDMCLGIVGETNQPPVDFLLFQECKFVLPGGDALVDAGILIEGVIVA